MTKRPGPDDRARQWCAVAGIAGVLAVTAGIHLGGPAVPDSSPPVMTEVTRSRPLGGRAVIPSARLADVSVLPATAPTHRRHGEPAARRVLPAGEAVVAGEALPAGKDLPAAHELRAAGVPSAAPIAGRGLPRMPVAALPSVASTPVSLDRPVRPRGPVTRALARAGAETGRGFRRVGAALARVF